MTIALFCLLQFLDAATTLVGLRLGAQEISPLTRHLITYIGPVNGLVLCKTFAFAIAAIAIYLRRPRVLRMANWTFGAIVAWNGFMIGLTLLMSLRIVLPHFELGL